MFDISFSELMVIAFVALVVIGPEKLPKVARTAGAFFGRLQRFVTQVKDEVNREARFAELQHLQQEVQFGLQQGVDVIEQSILSPTTLSQATVEGEVNLVKKPRKPRTKKTAPVSSQLVAEHLVEPAYKPELSTDNLLDSHLAESQKQDFLEKKAVATRPRKLRVKKAKPDSSII